MHVFKNMSKQNKVIIFILIGLFVIAIVLFLLISRTKYEPQTYYFNTSIDINTGGTVERSVESAEHIVYGYYTGHVKEIGMGTSRKGDLYTFQVEETWFGDIKGEIKVAISSHFELIRTVNGHTIIGKAPLPHYVDPDYNKKYILMLDHNKTLDAYVTPIVPNHIEISDDGVASLKYNRNTEGISKSDKGDIAIFAVEGVEVSEDNITGVSKDELYKMFKTEISKKSAQAE